MKGDVGDVRSECSFDRISDGKEVVFGWQSVLSLSRTRARMAGGFWALGWTAGPRFSGRWVIVGMVRWGRKLDGVFRRVETARLKARRLLLGGCMADLGGGFGRRWWCCLVGYGFSSVVVCRS